MLAQTHRKHSQTNPCTLNGYYQEDTLASHKTGTYCGCHWSSENECSQGKWECYATYPFHLPRCCQLCSEYTVQYRQQPYEQALGQEPHRTYWHQFCTLSSNKVYFHWKNIRHIIGAAVAYAKIYSNTVARNRMARKQNLTTAYLRVHVFIDKSRKDKWCASQGLEFRAPVKIQIGHLADTNGQAVWPPCDVLLRLDVQNHSTTLHNNLSNPSLVYCSIYLNLYDAIGSVIPCEKWH